MARQDRGRFRQNKSRKKGRAAPRVPAAPASPRPAGGGMPWAAIVLFWAGLAAMAAYPRVSEAFGWSGRSGPGVDSQPPVIEITAPAVGAEVAGAGGGAAPGTWRVEVRASVRDDRSGPLEVRLRAGGEGTVMTEDGGVFRGWATLTAEGPQEIEVVAHDAAGNRAQARVRVRCAARPEATKAP